MMFSFLSSRAQPRDLLFMERDKIPPCASLSRNDMIEFEDE